MIFFHYLTSEGQQLIEMIAKARFRIQENISWCADGKYAGAVIKENKTFFICTKNILKGSNASQYLNETVYHEAVHVVQACKGMQPIGIPINRMPLPKNKIQDIDRSLSLTNKKFMRRMEHEAYWLEDKPKETIKYLRKFCF
jgi:plastocyanin domain-containing protein